MKSNFNTRKGKYSVRKELVSDPVSEWYEFRVYRGKERVVSFQSEAKAEAWVWALTH